MAPPHPTQTATAADRLFLYGAAAGLAPAVLLCLFGFTQCPLTGPMGDYTCHDANQGFGGWFFVLAVAIYLAEVLAMVVCLFFRRVRPVAWGLLLMLVLSPILGIVGFYAISIARHPLHTSLGPLTPALSLAWRLRHLEF